MIHCPKCTYAWNPDTATICVQCKAPLESVAQSRRGDTFNENLQPSEPARRQTVAEGIPAPSSSSTAPKVPTPITPSPRWNSAPESTPSNPPSSPSPNRKTVFAGISPSGEVPASASGGLGRQQTIAVVPNRKIVGVLITYSWQETGQVFPILEGRNLIGKDPNQCDICIPQDTTLSAVNSFISYRRNFIIGDKVSMSGTDVDGEPIESESVTLNNYAKIRTGSTYWTFVSIQPPQSPAQGTEQSDSSS